MTSLNKIFLVGPMGAGKTTIGRFLAAELQLPFKDTDKEIEARCGADVAWIFDVEGEQGFRDRESIVLEDLSHLSEAVIATGGGIVLRESNRKILAKSGLVIYLQVSVDQQVERTSHDRSRPLLQRGDPRKVLTELMAIRDPLYREIADLVIETDERRPRLAAREVADKLREQEQ